MPMPVIAQLAILVVTITVQVALLVRNRRAAARQLTELKRRYGIEERS